MTMMKKTIIKREIISRETIKPSSPTPPHLKSYKLSLLDQIAPNMHVRFSLFYPLHQDHSCEESKFGDDNRSTQLKKSLSEILTHYYPFAGRFRDKSSIDCNDAGVEFVDSRINCDLSEILNDPYSGKLNLFFSSDLLEKTPDLLLIIQVSILQCQGIAIGVSCSHAIADASTLSTFMNDWASKAHFSSGEEFSPPQFIASSTFPPNHLLTMPKLELEKGNFVTKRYVFNASSIDILKDTVIAAGVVQNPTRFELVTALILRCAVAASIAVSGYLKRTCAMQNVNLRKRMIPPLPSNSIGNMVWVFPVTMMTEMDIELTELVKKLKEGKNNFNKMEVLKSTGDEWFPFISQSIKDPENMFSINSQINLYRVISWCKFGFYDLDFGWGKPVWLGMGNAGYKNTIVLNDTSRGDEIEAMVTLEEQEMALFDRDAEILAASSSCNYLQNGGGIRS